MSRARILAVDDQAYFRAFVEGMLTEEGYDVRTASSGEEALRWLERERFDVVLTDLVMPEMDGSELVRRIREREAEQEVVVVSGVGDVKTAVDAMKLGATDYLLKPIDRTALARSLEGLLQRKRLREEHSRLMAENLEYMGVLSLYERAIGLVATLALEPLSERIVEGLCLETRAQSGVLWVARENGTPGLRLLALRGLVRSADEPAEIPADAAGLEAPEDEGSAANATSPQLQVPIRHGGRLLALARLADRLDGRDFDARDRAAAEKFAELAGLAIANALRFRSLESRSFRDPASGAYTEAYFQDVLRNELQKADRFGRSFSLLLLALEPPAPSDLARDERQRFRHDVAHHVGRALRSTDLLAEQGGGRFGLLLPETDALGAAVLKRRIREALEQSDLLQGLDPPVRPQVLLAAASYPADATQLESLWQLLQTRLEEERRSLVRSLGLDASSFAASVHALLAQAEPAPAALPEQVSRFVLDEVARRPRERGLLFLAPGAGLSGPVREGLERLRGAPTRTEIVLVDDGPADPLAGSPVTCVSPRRVGTRVPFLVYYGEGPAYALLRQREGDGGSSGVFHTADRALVEHLAFQLQRDLGMPVAP